MTHPNNTLWPQVAEACNTAVAERGAFALAIPGGSILKVKYLFFFVKLCFGYFWFLFLGIAWIDGRL